jgi:hypothetical protein
MMWASIATGLLGIADTVADSLFETEDAKAKARVAVIGALQRVDLAQLQLTTTEAQHRSLFVAGWRPAIGWVCAFAVAYQFVIHPLLTWGFLVSEASLPPLPSFDAFLWELMFGMLGIAGLRTVEKVRNITR